VDPYGNHGCSPSPHVERDEEDEKQKGVWLQCMSTT